MTPDISAPRQPPPSGPAGGRSTGPATAAAVALLATLVVTATATLVTVSSAPLTQRTPLAWYGSVSAVLLCAAVTTAAYHHYGARRLRTLLAAKDAEIASQEAAAAEREAAGERFARTTVPFVVERLRQGASAETALAAAPPTENGAQRGVLTTLATEVHRGEGLRASAMSACANAAGRVQALATSMAADLRDMEHRHADEDVLGDLLHLDHRTAQAGRLADSIAVLTGARSGRRWAKPIVMESILRGALGRISGYQRVRLHSTSTAAVAGHAAEGVMHLLAELMDNAANFSPPTSEVHVYVEEVTAGVVVTVEDGGLVMGEVALRRAQQAVSGEAFDLSALSGSRLGLAVVGRLARKHGLSVSFRPSAHGGTGVVVMLPQELITEIRRPDRTPAPEAGPGGGSRSGSRTGSDTAGGQRPDSARENAAIPLPPQAPASGGSEPKTTPEAPGPKAASEASGAASAPERPEPAERQDSAEDTEPAEHTATADSSAEDTRPAAGSPAGEAREAQAPAAEPEFGESGLPKRRRGRTLASAQRQRAEGDRTHPAAPRRTPEQSGSRLGAFRQAVQGAQQARTSLGRDGDGDGSDGDGTGTGAAGTDTAAPDAPHTADTADTPARDAPAERPDSPTTASPRPEDTPE